MDWIILLYSIFSSLKAINTELSVSEHICTWDSDIAKTIHIFYQWSLVIAEVKVNKGIVFSQSQLFSSLTVDPPFRVGFSPSRQISVIIVLFLPARPKSFNFVCIFSTYVKRSNVRLNVLLMKVCPLDLKNGISKVLLNPHADVEMTKKMFLLTF